MTMGGRGNSYRHRGSFPLVGLICRSFFWGFLVFAMSACSHLNENKSCPVESATHTPVLLQIYQGPLNHLSAVRRGECPMVPSCSEFSGQAIEKHGVVVGWIMSVDRLLRCGRDELNSARQVFAGGQWKAADPVENNDFWWASTQKSGLP
jgi:uncharacterized protein